MLRVARYFRLLLHAYFDLFEKYRTVAHPYKVAVNNQGEYLVYLLQGRSSLASNDRVVKSAISAYQSTFQRKHSLSLRRWRQLRSRKEGWLLPCPIADVGPRLRSAYSIRCASDNSCKVICSALSGLFYPNLVSSAREIGSGLSVEAESDEVRRDPGDPAIVLACV